ncbi:hypothetical protein QN345_00670 [Cryobacterium sp. 10I1]|nr:hypothetical protein [Cryobacterium sp. 10I1]MEB0303853.1 hypothetical protein [Cryobacterium sp. 10I1]
MHTLTRRIRRQWTARHDDTGDVPGWVLITLVNDACSHLSTK